MSQDLRQRVTEIIYGIGVTGHERADTIIDLVRSTPVRLSPTPPPTEPGWYWGRMIGAVDQAQAWPVRVQWAMPIGSRHQKLRALIPPDVTMWIEDFDWFGPVTIPQVDIEDGKA